MAFTSSSFGSAGRVGSADPARLTELEQACLRTSALDAAMSHVPLATRKLMQLDYQQPRAEVLKALKENLGDLQFKNVLEHTRKAANAQVGPRPAEVAGVGLRYRNSEQTWRLGEYSDAPASTRTYENRLADFDLTIGSRQFANGVDWVPVQGAVLSPPARAWTEEQIQLLVEDIAGRLYELTREDFLWGGMGIAMMYLRLGMRYAEHGAFLPNHVLYARMACGITSTASLKGASAMARSEERCATSAFGYAVPQAMLDTSPVDAPLALSQFELIKAYMHSVGGEGIHEEGQRKDCVRRFRAFEEEIMSLDNDEWMQGRCMYLACALQLNESFSGDGILQATIGRMANAIYDRAVEHAKNLYASMVDKRDPAPDHLRVPPLFCYSKDRWPWMGARRGLFGLLHTLMSVESIVADEKKMDTIRTTIDWIIRQESEPGRFCCVAFSEPGEKPSWGDGGGGAVMLFAKAFELYYDPKYAMAAQRSAERLWTYALSRGSSGLMEGTAGNGYAFLRMFNCARLAVERSNFTPMCAPEVWVHRAHMCSRFVMESYNVRPAEFDLSFADGNAGVVCFLMDMLEPGKACFPLFEIGRF